MRRRMVVLFSLAVVMAIAGIPLIGIYGWTLWSVMDGADRSLVFWHSPFLIFGLFLLVGALTFALLGWIMRRENAGPGARPKRMESDNAH